MKTGPATSALRTMADVWEAYRDDLEEVEDQVRKNLDSSVALVNTVAAHILSSGGKRIRPLLLLLSSRLCGYAGKDDLILASLVEYIHTATLLHDDVVDDADLRRGRQAARRVWGNQVSILVGDYLYSKAICHIVSFHNQAINEVLSEACQKMAEGEVLQLYYNGNPSITETEYLRIVTYKTAGLIAASCRIGAIIGKSTTEQQHALCRFGEHLGIAFQLADDTLDYAANGDRLGKSLGQDLRQGKATLPLLHLLQHCPEQDRQMIKDRMETRTLTETELLRIISLMQECGSIGYAMQRAHEFVMAAQRDLSAFEDSSARRALSVVAEYMVTRDR
ncbi:MAG TPA: polyprenyl synthetase family protein [Nitrospiraceae bacterium]|jgi:octaprenyl-diphosphate synthase|nr:polyprenyl synthetase family protein [Nitrospiraceae bacterium]